MVETLALVAYSIPKASVACDLMNDEADTAVAARHQAGVERTSSRAARGHYQAGVERTSVSATPGIRNANLGSHTRGVAALYPGLR